METKLWVQTSGTNFKQVPLEVGWKYTSKRNKSGLITFDSPSYISSGTHIKLTGNFPTIGGLIVRIEQDQEEINSYTGVDYKNYLMGEINYTSKKQVRSHQVLQGIKKNVPELKWNIGKTTKKYKNKLVWKKKTVLQIINELIWLEWKYAKKLVYFNVDHNRNLTFKYYPTQVEGYKFHQAHKYSNTYDASQILTGWKVVDSDGKLVESYANPALTATYGHLFTIISAEEEEEKKKDKK